jgi:MoaA/NifB/PqqE/SkfB family radical SAM enzyme
MSMEEYTRFTDEVAPTAIAFFLYVIGEPFMNRHLPDMIRHAHESRIFTVVSTNGHFIGSVDHAREVVKSGLDELIVSISGLDQETYALYHRGGRIEKVKQGIRNLALAKKELGARNPWITVRYLEFGYNGHERGPAERAFRDLGADAFESRPGRSTYDTVSMPDQPSERMGRYRDRFLSRTRPRARRRRPCRWPWLISVVNWDGSLAVCTQYPWIRDEADPNCIGNVFAEGGFRKVWQGSRARAFRKRAHTGIGLPPFCAGCTRGVGFGDNT